MAAAACVLRSAGHRARVAAAAAFRHLLEETYGVPWVEAGDDWTEHGQIGRSLSDARRRGNDAFVAEVLRRATVAAPRMASALTRVCETDPPDVILRDSACLGAYVAGSRLGVRTVALDVGVSEYTSGIGPTIKRARLSLDDADRPEAVLTPAPLGLLLDGENIHAFRHEDAQRAGERLPHWVPSLPPDRPLVYVALGSLLPSGLADLTVTLYRRIVDALAPMNVSAIISTGTPSHHEISAYAAPYPHIRTMPQTPQPLLLRAGVDVFLTHAGFASMREAIAHAVPMVCLPLTTDQPMNAARLAAVGLAVTLDSDPSVDAIRHAVRTVLLEPRYQRTARTWQRRMLALPPLPNVLEGVLRAA